MRRVWGWMALLVLTGVLALTTTGAVMADTSAAVEQMPGEGIKVMEAFARQEAEQQRVTAVADHTKRVVMFLLGVPLLLLLLATGGLGVAMVVYGKPLFIPHMICAGLSITLAIAHAVVGMVWFYPF